jgi:thiamine biosynthesis protein ThiS
MNEAIHIVVNGEARQVSPQLTVTRLVQDMGLDPARLAVERNLEILPRARWQDTRLEDGDRFEIVQFVGGG